MRLKLTFSRNYLIFFILEQGYDLTFRAPKAETPAVIEFDAPSFAHVILFAPETKSISLSRSTFHV